MGKSTPEWEALLSSRGGAHPVMGLVSPGPDGKVLPYDDAKKALQRSAKRPSLAEQRRVGIHALRRTAITVAEEVSGGNATALTGVARHTSLAVTRRYLPKVPESVRQVSLLAVKRLARSVGKVVPLRPRRVLEQPRQETLVPE